MKHRFSKPDILIIVIASLLAVFILVLLSMWTRALYKRDQTEMLRAALEAMVETEGEKALLEAAGVPVDDIHYSYQDIPLYSGEKASWNYTEEDLRGIAVYRKASASVVQISGADDLQKSVEGSGVIVSPDGYIVTNKHVVGNATSFIVRFFDSSTAEASLVGYDSLSDIALLKAEAGNLSPIELASPDDLMIGESVYAIGHPFGYAWSMSKGIVSGLDRLVADGVETIPAMIQTDAAINPGNSGGPLLDGEGKMVGLISRINTVSGVSDGVGFAIPSSRVMDSVQEIIDTGTVSRGWLDLLSVELNPVIADYVGLPVDKGVLVSQVVPGGEADKGGVRGGSSAVQYGQSVIYLGGDLIIGINDAVIDGYDDYFAALFDTKAGDAVSLTIIRNGNKMVLENVLLVERTAENSRWIAR